MTMVVAILGTQITVWCFDLQHPQNDKFKNIKVVIGDGNDIADLKKAIKEKCKPFFDSFPYHLLRL